jgi:cytochrome c nitrite reductase small subunit
MAITKKIKSLEPPPKWKFPVLILLGILVGFGLLILRISNATSYLSDEPTACVNCHVMNPQFATWQRSSHARVATCNDCHVPQDNPIKTYAFKASDGLRHSFMFTFRLEPEVIRIKDAGRDVVQQNCIRCHLKIMDELSLISVTGEMTEHGEGKLCWECHRGTPHGTITSLSSLPMARIPRVTPVMPDWLEKFISIEKEKN